MLKARATIQKSGLADAKWIYQDSLRFHWDGYSSCAGFARFPDNFLICVAIASVHLIIEVALLREYSLKFDRVLFVQPDTGFCDLLHPTRDCADARDQQPFRGVFLPA